MIHRFLNLLFILNSSLCLAQKPFAPSDDTWRASIHREDGTDIVFNFRLHSGPKPVMYITNGNEQISIKNIRFTGDSVFIQMPVFESSFRAKADKNTWSGVWLRNTSAGLQTMPFTAEKGKPRYMASAPATFNMSGRWAVNFSSDHQDKPVSLAEFKQTGNKLTGTFLTPSGDYRYQEGIVSGNTFMLSGFDGAHAFYFTGTLSNNKTITNATYYSGAKYKESWTATKDANAKVSTDPVAMNLKPEQEQLNFSFPDLNGKMVSINDQRFKNKVVVVQLMGSWCPNCMDETDFLSKYYLQNKARGVEMVSLAYEYSTDFNRSVASLKKFQQRFNVQYPMLITGVTVRDSLRTEKTLPQVTDIKVFPSSIIIDKKGKVRYFDTDFFGQGTGEHFTAYVKKFNETINKLLNEK